LGDWPNYRPIYCACFATVMHNWCKSLSLPFISSELGHKVTIKGVE
jgi:hypothetical protein